MTNVLVHGGGCGASCWDRLVPLLTGPTVAVDLPGRGCNDMDDALVEYTLARLVPESPRVIIEPVDLSGLHAGTPRTYVRLGRDLSVTPEQQNTMIDNLGGADVVDIDCGHMAMISRPAELAAIINEL